MDDSMIETLGHDSLADSQENAAWQNESQTLELSGHLPECWYSDPDKALAATVNPRWPCICYLLRACEQRVMDEHGINPRQQTLAEARAKERERGNLMAWRHEVRYPIDRERP